MTDQFPITPLRRCLEVLKLTDQIGAQDSMWLAERAINAYLESVTPSLSSKMQALEALRISWSQNKDASDLLLICNYIEKVERDLRDRAQVSQKVSPLSSPIPSDIMDKLIVRYESRTGGKRK